VRYLVAAMLLAAGLRADPAKSAEYFRQGLAQETAKQYPQALKSFTLSFGEELSSFKFYREMGNCYYYLGQKAAARDCYAKYLKLAPGDAGVARLHDALAKLALPAREETPAFSTDALIANTIHYRVNWFKGSIATRNTAAKLGKPALYYMGGASAKDRLNPNYSTGAGDIHKALRKFVFDDLEYAAWIDQNYVLCDLADMMEYNSLAGRLCRTKSLPPFLAKPLFIASNYDWSDFRWDYSFLRAETTMLFLMEAKRDMAKPKA
jgi:tetratricopeptide (TPR) repeat protein